MSKHRHGCAPDEKPVAAKHRGRSAKSGLGKPGNVGEDSLAEIDTTKMNDIASPKMQLMYHEQLKEHSLKHMYSRAGKNTMNHHFEFMKAKTHNKQDQLDEADRVQPKIQSHLGGQKKTKEQGTSETMKEKIQKTIEINLKNFQGGVGNGPGSMGKEINVTDTELVAYIDWWKQNREQLAAEQEALEAENLMQTRIVNENLRYQEQLHLNKKGHQANFKNITREKHFYQLDGKNPIKNGLDKVPPPAHYKPKYHYIDKHQFEALVKGRNIEQDPADYEKKIIQDKNTICTKMLRTLKKEPFSSYETAYHQHHIPLERHDVKKRVQSGLIRIQEQIPTDSQPNLDVENINIKNSLNDDMLNGQLTGENGGLNTVDSTHKSPYQTVADPESPDPTLRMENGTYRTVGQGSLQNKPKPSNLTIDQQSTMNKKSKQGNETEGQELASPENKGDATTLSGANKSMAASSQPVLNSAEELKKKDQQMIGNLGFDHKFKYPNIQINNKYHIIQVEKQKRDLFAFNPTTRQQRGLVGSNHIFQTDFGNHLIVESAQTRSIASKSMRFTNVEKRDRPFSKNTARLNQHMKEALYCQTMGDFGAVKGKFKRNQNTNQYNTMSRTERNTNRQFNAFHGHKKNMTSNLSSRVSSGVKPKGRNGMSSSFTKSQTITEEQDIANAVPFYLQKSNTIKMKQTPIQARTFRFTEKSLDLSQKHRNRQQCMPTVGQAFAPRESTMYDFNSTVPRPAIFTGQVTTQADYNTDKDGCFGDSPIKIKSHKPLSLVEQHDMQNRIFMKRLKDNYVAYKEVPVEVEEI